MVARPIPIASGPISIRMLLSRLRSARVYFFAELFACLSDPGRIFSEDLVVASRLSHFHLGVNATSTDAILMPRALSRLS